MLFSYDFTDLTSAAEVVVDLQTRLKSAMGMANLAVDNIDYGKEAEVLEILKLKAHIYLLSDELNLIFDAIKLAQDRGDESVDRKSALLVNATSSEMSWNMLDERRELLAKLVVRDTDFYWLSRRDSSTVNNLTIGSLQAFDGSKDAIWPEILSKHDEPANHPLLQVCIFEFIFPFATNRFKARTISGLGLVYTSSSWWHHHLRKLRSQPTTFPPSN